MDDLFRDYWWLLFPLAFFAFGAWDRWLAYQRSKDRLDLLRTYTSQGKDPPPELIKALREDDEDQDEATAYGRYDRYGRRYRRYRSFRRYGPYWAWRSALVTGSVAAGFWFAAYYADLPGVDWSFRLVAVIMSCVAAGNLIAAIFASTFPPRR